MRIVGSYGWNRTAGGLRRPDLPPLPALVEVPSRLGRKGCEWRELVAMNVAGVNESGGDWRSQSTRGKWFEEDEGVSKCGDCVPGVVVEDR